MIFPLKMVIFNSYVNLPEGMGGKTTLWEISIMQKSPLCLENGLYAIHSEKFREIPWSRTSRFRVRWRQLWVDVQTIVASSVIRYIHEANSFSSHGLVSTCGPHLLVIPQALFITSVRRDCLLVASRHLLRGSVYHLVIQHSHGKSPFFIGK